MTKHNLLALCFMACAAFVHSAYAQESASVHTSFPASYENALRNAFECRSLSKDIDAALQARQITVLDGQTHAQLDPPIRVLGFMVRDVTVFRDSGEDIYAIYVKDKGPAISAALKKATWPNAKGFTASSLPGGVTRLACSISSGDSAGED